MKRDSALVGAGLLGILVLFIQLLDYGYGRDQGIYAAVARVIREGGVPYRDAWDFKPPGIFFVYAAAGALFGDGVMAIRVLECVALAAMVGAFATLSRHYCADARPGLVGGALAVLGHVQLEFWHTAQPESFGAALVAWGLVCAARALDGGPRRGTWEPSLWWAAAGACAGAASLLKPTIGIAGAASLAIAAARHPRDAFRTGGLFLGGAVLATAPCALFFLARGGFGELLDALLAFAPRYAGVAFERGSVVSLSWRLLIVWFWAFSALTLPGVLLLLTGPLAGREREGVVHVGAAATLLAIGVLAQGRLFPYHFGAVLPLTALLAGWGWWRLWALVRSTAVGAAGFAVLVVLLMSLRSATTDVADTFWDRCRLRVISWTHAGQRQDIRDRLYSVKDYRAADNRLVAEWLASATDPAATVFVYGFTPEVYVKSARRPATRYIHNLPMRAAWSRESARGVVMSELRRSIPEAIVVEHGDVGGSVVGGTADSAADLRGFVALQTYLASHYVRLPAIGKFDVYRRAR